MGELGYNVSDERGCDAAMAVCGGMCVYVVGAGVCVRFVRSGQVEWCLTRGLLYFAGAAGSVCIRNVQGGAARGGRHESRHVMLRVCPVIQAIINTSHTHMHLMDRSIPSSQSRRSSQSPCVSYPRSSHIACHAVSIGTATLLCLRRLPISSTASSSLADHEDDKLPSSSSEAMAI